MKVKIKGLVFVGFAAMIFAANAMAASDNTVTSKTYVDTHFQQKSGAASIGNSEGSWTPLDQTIPATGGESSAPTSAAVRAALANATQVDNFVEDEINDAVTTKAPSENAVHDALALKEDAANKVTSVTSASDDTQYPSAKAVYDALHNTANVGNGALTVTVDGGTVTGSFAANQADPSTIAITGLESSANKKQTIDTTATPEQKAANYPSQAAVEAYVANATDIDNFVEDSITDAVTDKAPSENAVHDALALKEDVANKVGTIDTTATAEQKAANYPSQAAVEAYVANATDIDNFVEDSITDAVTDKAPSENAVHDALALKVDIAQGAEAANKTLVTDANGNVTVSSIESAVLPAKPSTCTATNPCALVTEGNNIVWKPIAQAEANVGA